MTRELLDRATEIPTTVPPLNGTTANGTNPNGGVVTWRAEQQRQAADAWIYNDVALRQAMTSLGIPVSPNIHEDFAPGVPIPADRPGQVVDPRPLLLDTDVSKKARADVAAKLGVSEKALIDGIHAEHGITNTLPRTTPGSTGAPIGLKTDPFTIKTARASITGDAASLEASRKALYDAMSANTDPHMAAKKAAYDSSSGANAGWDAKNPAAQLKINQNYTLGHEVKLQINSAAEDLLTQMKGVDAATAIDNLKATASHPDLAKYKDLQAKYDQLASQGKWREASEVLVEQHTLVQGKADLILAIAAEKAITDLGGNAAAVTPASIDAAIAKRKDESAKINADLKRLEIREYDVRLVMLKPTSVQGAQASPSTAPNSGGGQGAAPAAGTAGAGGGAAGPVAGGGGTPAAAMAALPQVPGGPYSSGSSEVFLRIGLESVQPGLIINSGPEAAQLGLRDGDQIVAVTGDTTKPRIELPLLTNDNIRDYIFNGMYVDLEVKRKDTGAIEILRINVWKKDPAGRYGSGTNRFEEDVRLVSNTPKPGGTHAPTTGAGGTTTTPGGAAAGGGTPPVGGGTPAPAAGGSPVTSTTEWGLGISVTWHHRMFGMLAGDGAEIASLHDSLSGHKKLEVGEDKIEKVQFIKADGTYWKSFPIKVARDYMMAMKELAKYNNSVPEAQRVTYATLYISDTNGPWRGAEREQVDVPVLQNQKDEYFP